MASHPFTYTHPCADYYSCDPSLNYAYPTLPSVPIQRWKHTSSEEDDDDDSSRLSSTTIQPELGQSDSSSSRRRVRAKPTEEKDASYYEKRARNNESAKRSREARRIKEEQIQERLRFLEHEHSRLSMENQAMRYQISQLHAFYSTTDVVSK